MLSGTLLGAQCLPAHCLRTRCPYQQISLIWASRSQAVRSEALGSQRCPREHSVSFACSPILIKIGPFLWLLAEVKFCTMAQFGHCAKIAWSPGTMKKADFAQIWDIYRAQLAEPRPGVRALHGFSVLRPGLSPLSSPGHTKA